MGFLQRLVVRLPQKFIPKTASPPLPTTVPATFTPFLRLYFRSSDAVSSATMSAATTITTPMDTIFKQKKALRSQVKKELKSMDPILRSHEDDVIQRIILEAPWFRSCRRLCAYISCGALREVDTSKIISEILKNTGQDDISHLRKKLYVPRVEDKNSFMRMMNISILDDLIANSMDILEPAPYDAEGNEREDVMFASEPVDLFLLPGLAFDKSGRRLGRGGGYYDSFLAKYQELANDRKWKKPLFVALTYSRQILEDGVIPITPNDVPVDALVSSSGVIPISPAAREIYL
ncbi:5-formyltetrahydrofolate cyclo-ligase, mitochondrial [Orobanche gracilis]